MNTLFKIHLNQLSEITQDPWAGSNKTSPKEYESDSRKAPRGIGLFSHISIFVRRYCELVAHQWWRRLFEKNQIKATLFSKMII